MKLVGAKMSFSLLNDKIISIEKSREKEMEDFNIR